jgi:hypothetical protein
MFNKTEETHGIVSSLLFNEYNTPPPPPGNTLAVTSAEVTYDWICTSTALCGFVTCQKDRFYI